METPAKEPTKLTFPAWEENMLEIRKEIDELALQLSLGKANARDKFEESKKEFKTKLASLKHLLNNVALSQFVPVRLEWKLQDLELQLQPGAPASKKTFEVQRSSLIAATIELGKDVAEVFQKAKLSNHFRHEVEKFLLKLEILRLKFGIKRFEIKDSFRSNMRGAERMINQMTSKVKSAGSTARSSQREAKREIAVVYKHLKNAVKNL